MAFFMALAEPITSAAETLLNLVRPDKRREKEHREAVDQLKRRGICS